MRVAEAQDLRHFVREGTCIISRISTCRIRCAHVFDGACEPSRWVKPTLEAQLNGVEFDGHGCGSLIFKQRLVFTRRNSDG